jgi:hypothetical protein
MVIQLLPRDEQNIPEIEQSSSLSPSTPLPIITESRHKATGKTTAAAMPGISYCTLFVSIQ